MGVTYFQLLCIGKPELLNVVSSKSALVVHIVDDVQALEPKLIQLDDLEVEYVLGDIPSMSRGQHSHHTLHVVQSSPVSKMFSKKPPLTRLSKLNLSAVDYI